eukprot:TRINITY_DN12194_c0_g1_i3.p2 TRINITY_DN12194_c0_g1~~TRINITY_DN12194_c0_g1_i3.p2  ORF type:complete len:440 (+),score=92.76 TRINITY_DN12194_c0_g1_i3:54-1322(+)
MSNLYTPPPFAQNTSPSSPSPVNNALLKEAQQEINQLRDELFQAKRTAWQKNKDYEEANTAKQDLQNQVQSLTKQLQQLQHDAQLGKDLSEQAEDLKQQVESQTKEIEQLKEARRILQKELAEERSAREAAENAKGTLEAERSRILHEGDHLKTEVKFLKRRIHEVEEELVTSEQEALSLRSEVRSGGISSATVQREASLSRAKSIELQEERTKVEKLSNQLVQYQQEIETLEKQLAQTQTQNQPKQKQQQQQQQSSSILEMERKVAMFKKSRDKLLTELDTQSVEIDRLLSENQALQSSFEESQEIQNKWRAQAEDALRQIESLKDMMEESASWVIVDNNIATDETEQLKKISFLEQELVQGRAKIAKMDLQIRALCAEFTKTAQCTGAMHAKVLPALNAVEGRLMRLKNNQVVPENFEQA